MLTGYLAQLGEHLFDVQEVGGSIPSVPTTQKINPEFRIFSLLRARLEENRKWINNYSVFRISFLSLPFQEIEINNKLSYNLYHASVVQW